MVYENDADTRISKDAAAYRGVICVGNEACLVLRVVSKDVGEGAEKRTISW